jgi:signal peptidase I
MGERKPWKAVLFSMVSPGLGHVYLGRAARGAKLYCVFMAVLPLGGFLAVRIPLFPLNLILPILCLLFLYLYVIFDSVRTAKRCANPFRPKEYNRWYIYVLLILASAAVQEFAARPAMRMFGQEFRITSGSMMPALQIGDHILVDKLWYVFNPIQRGDVLVYRLPQDESRSFVHRAIGLPGETLEIREKRVFINGTPLEEPYATYGDWQTGRHGVPDRLGPITIPPGKIFMMGDNRDHSFDGRAWGFLDARKVQGKVVQIYLSTDPDTGTIRSVRMGTRVK